MLNAPEIWVPLVAMLVLVFASGFFSSSETALFYLSHDELRSLRGGGLRERVVVDLLLNPDRLLTGILFWNLVINLSYFALSVVVASRLAGEEGPTIAGLFGLVSLLGIILFGEVLPKNLAVVMRRRLALWVSLPLAASLRVLDPIVPFFAGLSRVARRAFWPHLKAEAMLDADDLERAVESSTLAEEIIRQERRILHNVLDLSEITAEEVMRPRGTYVTFSGTVTLGDLGGEVPPGGYVLMTVPEGEDIESVIPITTFSFFPEEHLEHAAEDVVHVPWCADLASTLQLLRDRFCSVAAVVDEYGATLGIVTYEDILDTVLGAEPSRARRVLNREPVLPAGEGTFQVEGMTTLRYLSKRLGIEFEPEPAGAVTVAGVLHEQLKDIPRAGDVVSWRGFRIEVLEQTERGHVRVRVERGRS
jgi:CBS domain containing-hemolysin-like protein